MAAQDRNCPHPLASSPRAPTSHPVWGHAREFDRDQLHYLTFLAREYGDVVPRLPPYRVVFFNHPDLIEQVLVSKQQAFLKGTIVHRLGEGARSRLDHQRRRAVARPASPDPAGVSP
jgi:hypothetical protein